MARQIETNQEADKCYGNDVQSENNKAAKENCTTLTRHFLAYWCTKGNILKSGRTAASYGEHGWTCIYTKKTYFLLHTQR